MDSQMRPFGRFASGVGRGILAGAVGTAAMTLSSTIEMKLRKRDPSTAPAEAASEVLGVRVRKQDQEKFANVVHWQYGSCVGAVRGLLSVFRNARARGFRCVLRCRLGCGSRNGSKTYRRSTCQGMGSRAIGDRRLPPSGLCRFHQSRDSNLVQRLEALVKVERGLDRGPRSSRPHLRDLPRGEPIRR
jgi:hypothetical protein